MKYPGNYPVEDVLFETMLSKLGSRLVLIPKAAGQKMAHGLLGFYYDKPVETTIAVSCEGKVRSLPFSSEYQTFEFLHQEIGLTYVAYYCRSDQMPLEMVCTICAPFCPQDLQLSTAPFFYLTVRISNPTDRKLEGSLLTAMENVLGHGHTCGGTSAKARSDLYSEADRIGFSFEDSSIAADQLLFTTGKADTSYAIGDLDKRLYPDFAATGRLNNTLDNRYLYSLPSGLCWRFGLDPGEAKEKVFVYAGYHPCDALRTHDRESRFIYTTYFENAAEVAEYAAREYVKIREKTDFFENTLAESSLPGDTKQLIAFAFQSYIANTWWTCNDEEWFIVWEGHCRFHSTIDVGYNIELFSLFFWPDLLKMQLQRWSHYRIDGYLAHDIGDDRYVCGQTYDHDMPVEESTNYVLLLYAYWRFTADTRFAEGKYELVKGLLHYLMSTDEDGDGIPDEAAAVRNTVDVASATIEGSAGQTYLAVKCLAAYTAGRALAQQCNDAGFAATCGQWLERLETTLVRRSWREDHFAVCLEEGAEGWDGHSIYASNGLLYLLLTNTDIPFPDKFRKDIESHLSRLMREYGCPHSSVDETIWMSQNIWRDLAGLYLGLNTIENSRRYWKFQLTRNASDEGAYTDVYHCGLGHTDLDRYPRGLTAMGYLYGLGGISVDAVKRTLTIAPPVASLRLPLTICADWEKQQSPWISLKEKDDEVLFRITDFRTLSGFSTICLRLPTMAKPTSVRFFSEPDFAIAAIAGETLKTDNGFTFRLQGTSQAGPAGFWVTELELGVETPTPPETLEIELMSQMK